MCACAFSQPGQQADLIFVFFDPMGQALCKRTLNIVEKLSETCADRLRFYLSKADEAGKETDRQVRSLLPMNRVSLTPVTVMLCLALPYCKLLLCSCVLYLIS